MAQGKHEIYHARLVGGGHYVFKGDIFLQSQPQERAIYFPPITTTRESDMTEALPLQNGYFSSPEMCGSWRERERSESLFNISHGFLFYSNPCHTAPVAY
jgi:hypothetical protein